MLIYQHDHSHPDDNDFYVYPNPSGFDKNGEALPVESSSDADTAKDYEQINPNIMLRVYVPRYDLFVKLRVKRL
jgi:hypothetical protein